MPRFFQWIEDQGGVNVLAEKLGVAHSTVSSWVNKKTTPKAIVMQKIVKMAKGVVTYDDIINETKGTTVERRRASGDA